jgi:type IV secretory pathway VirB2 component (pilin)
MTRRARQAAVTTIATVALVASFVLIAPMPADSATSRTLLTKMHIVGGPVAALGSVVIITTSI